ncbi:ATP-dependent dethiobiotin synthetase BioD [Mycolicibacterium thermoresistibile]|uniref:ATP-dependent dethiobiotin synthetase BioD n=1 Tax=Mycolicibacterium thermoresistibile TaxID=1797 RepID=A0A100XHS8_MYCTH|nr:ATP-dependent dethiobiotin synthetase BioD [Mycolicibacterium thermoresistibile]
MPIGTVPSSDTPAANGTTTAMIAVAAVSAAITEACANSTGCRDPARCGLRACPVMVIARFCQPARAGGRIRPLTPGPAVGPAPDPVPVRWNPAILDTVWI